MWSFVVGSSVFLRFIRILSWSSTSYLLMPNGVLLYGYITFCYLFISWWKFVLFPHFGVLWTMLLWTFMYRFLCVCMLSFLLGIYLRVELLDHMVTLCLTFWGAARSFSQVATPFYIPTSNIWEFQFIQIMANVCYHPFLKNNLPSGSKVVSPCGFDLRFPND